MHPVLLDRPPDKVLRDAALFANGWARKAIDAYGVQASTLILTAAVTDGRGLMVTATRTTAIGELGNRFTVDIAGGGPLALTWDPATGILGGTLANGTNQSALKSAIDGLTGTPFATAYTGTETGNGTTPNAGYRQAFGGGTPDNWAYIEVVNAAATNCLVEIGDRGTDGNGRLLRQYRHRAVAPRHAAGAEYLYEPYRELEPSGPHRIVGLAKGAISQIRRLNRIQFEQRSI